MLHKVKWFRFQDLILFLCFLNNFNLSKINPSLIKDGFLFLSDCMRKLYFEKYGNGKTIVLLPGLLASTKYWKELIPELSKNHQIVIIDQLGFGNSPKPDSETNYSIIENIKKYKEIFDELDLKDITLVGFSSSSIIALSLVSNYPNLFKKILLISPPIHFTKESAIKSLNKSFKTYKYLMRKPLKYFLIPFISLFRNVLIYSAPLFITHISSDSARDSFKFTWKSLYFSIENIIINQNVFEDLKSINIPIKILCAKKDNIVILENLYAMKSYFNNIIIDEIDCSHQIPYERPEIVIRNLKKF